MSKMAFNQNILGSHSGCIQESSPVEKETKENQNCINIINVDCNL